MDFWVMSRVVDLLWGMGVEKAWQILTKVRLSKIQEEMKDHRREKEIGAA